MMSMVNSTKHLTNVLKHLEVKRLRTEDDVGFIALIFVSKYFPYDFFFEHRKKFNNIKLYV
jgi:HSP90 family molecular chaperone